MDTAKIKIGDGATAWASLPYLAGGSGGGLGPVTLTGVPVSGQAPIATSATAATWQSPPAGLQGIQGIQGAQGPAGLGGSGSGGAGSSTARSTLSPIGMIGQGDLNTTLNTALLATEYTAGIRMRVLEPKWSVLQTSALAALDVPTLTALQARIDAFVATGPDTVITLDLGLHYCGAWVEAQDPITDQYNQQWRTIRAAQSACPNLVWSATVRTWAADYIQKLFAGLNFRGKLWAVRTGMFGAEWAFPPQTNAANPDSWWAYDGTAQNTSNLWSAIPASVLGMAAPRKTKAGLSTFSDSTHASTFYKWYVDSIAAAANWVHDAVRLYTDCWICPLTPGGGMWAGLNSMLYTALLDNLVNGFGGVGAGNWWEEMYSLFRSDSQGCMNWCSSTNDNSGNTSLSATIGDFELSINPWDWTSTHAHAYMAANNKRRIYAENPGTTSDISPSGVTAYFNIARRWGYSGLVVVRESVIGTAGYATLANVATEIANEAARGTASATVATTAASPTKFPDVWRASLSWDNPSSTVNNTRPLGFVQNAVTVSKIRASVTGPGTVTFQVTRTANNGMTADLLSTGRTTGTNPIVLVPDKLNGGKRTNRLGESDRIDVVVQGTAGTTAATILNVTADGWQQYIQGSVSSSGANLMCDGVKWISWGGTTLGGINNPETVYNVISLARKMYMNTLRVVGFIDGNPIAYASQDWSHADRLIAMAGAAGMKVILDMSTFYGILHGNGWPNPFGSSTNQGGTNPGAASAIPMWNTQMDAVAARINTYTGVRYADDPTILMISIAGEPQAPYYNVVGGVPLICTSDELTAFYTQVSAHLKTVMPNRLVSPGGFILMDNPGANYMVKASGSSGIDWKAIFAAPGIDVPAFHVASSGDLNNYWTYLGNYCSTLANAQGGTGKPVIAEEIDMDQANSQNVAAGAGDVGRAASYTTAGANMAANNTAGLIVWNIGYGGSPNYNTTGSFDVNESTPLTFSKIISIAPSERLMIGGD